MHHVAGQQKHLGTEVDVGVVVVSSLSIVERAANRASDSRTAANLIETCLLLLFFAWWLSRGFLAGRDALYTHLGGLILFSFTYLRHAKTFLVVGKTVLLYSGLALLGALSALWAYDGYLVFLDAREMIAAVFSMVAINHICRTTDGVKRVLFSLKVVLIAAVVLALGSRMYSYGNREFLLMNSSAIAPFMLMSFAVVFMEQKTKRRCSFCLLAMLVALVPVLIVSSVRSVAVVAVIVLTYFVLLSMGTAIGRMVGALFLASIIAVIVIYGSWISSALEGTRYFRHYSHTMAYMDEGQLEGSVGFRLMVQNLAVDMIKQRPIAGHGLNNSRHLYERWIGMPTYSHSGLMELLVGLGGLGALLFLLIFYEGLRVFSRTWAHNKRGAAAGISILVGFMAFNLVGPLYTTVEMLISLVVISSPGMVLLLLSGSRPSGPMRIDGDRRIQA